MQKSNNGGGVCPYTAAAIVWPLADVMFDRGSCRNSFASDTGSALDWGSGGALDLGEAEVAGCRLTSRQWSSKSDHLSSSSEHFSWQIHRPD